MADLLGEIIDHKLREVASRARTISLDAARAAPPPRGFIQAITAQMKTGEAACIAEIKKTSPSRGLLRTDFDAAVIAKNYAAHGATCLSVLTDEKYFHGSANDLIAAKSVCDIPVLRKDFVVCEYQIIESRALGADAILLIVAALDDSKLNSFFALANELNLDVLVEVHSHEDLQRALNLQCKLIGINNRNLHTFETKLETSLELLNAYDEALHGRIIVSESGVHSRDDIKKLRTAGVNAFLIGEALMRAANPGEKLKSLFVN